ncbi:MAG: hypothetical protein M1825_001938 [Sarcosagium campestre]|nr:MAG: hypothetical protein M1825_001938 [Sarcosagium campestre]
MTSAALVGATGLVGSQILNHILSTASISNVTTLTRRPLPSSIDAGSSSKLNSIVDATTSEWPAHLSGLRQPMPQIFFSALATTRGAAGSFATQYDIDYTLNVDLARAAKQAGVRVYVLISAATVSSSSVFAYNRMKGELEEAVTQLGFEHVVLVKPGLILGSREETRVAEGIIRGVAGAMRKVGGGLLTDWWAQDASAIAKAAVVKGIKCLDEDGGEKGKVWQVNQAEILKLAKEAESTST